VLCAKGSAGIMKQYSTAKLTQPLMRKPGTERGEGVYEAITWEQALDVLTERLEEIRATDPSKLAFFTGRDQMQALTGLWAQQFGTPNWAAHGGFCSVNMAAAGLYSIGFSFWEFGAPDWDYAKYFILWGVAEDHSSNPIKIGLEKLKRHGGKFVTVNPGAHRLFGDRRRMAARSSPAWMACWRCRWCTCCCSASFSITNSWCATPTRPGWWCRRRDSRATPVPTRRQRPAADLGSGKGGLQERHGRRHRAGPVWRVRRA
jgi:hypothetical protein